MSISVDISSDKTLNGGPLALLLRQQYVFPIGLTIVQFSFTHAEVNILKVMCAYSLFLRHLAFYKSCALVHLFIQIVFIKKLSVRIFCY